MISASRRHRKPPSISCGEKREYIMETTGVWQEKARREACIGLAMEGFSYGLTTALSTARELGPRVPNPDPLHTASLAARG
jgi:hypothetical protein